LGATDRGVLAEILIFPSVIATIVTCNWDKILKAKIISGVDSRNKILSQTITNLLLQTAVGSLIVMLLYKFGFWAKFLSGYEAFLYSIAAIFFQILSNYLISMASCILPVEKTYLNKLIGVFGYLFFVIVVAFYDVLKVETAFLANMLVLLLVILSSILMLFKYGFIFKINSLRIDGLLESTKNIHVVMFEALALQVEIYFLLKYVDHGVAGAYLAFKVFEFPFRIISYGLIAGITPVVSNFPRSYLFKFLNFSVFMALFLLAIYYIFSFLINTFVVLILGESYGDYLWILKYMILAFSLNSILYVIQSLMYLKSNFRYYNNSLMISSVFKLIFSPIFFFVFGVDGLFLGVVLAPLAAIIYCYLIKDFLFYLK
jgi:hypothetical protein